jgi:hypothetical protein
MSAPYSACIEAASATPDMDVYTELYPIAYDHIVSITIEFVFLLTLTRANDVDKSIVSYAEMSIQNEKS